MPAVRVPGHVENCKRPSLHRRKWLHRSRKGDLKHERQMKRRYDLPYMPNAHSSVRTAAWSRQVARFRVADASRPAHGEDPDENGVPYQEDRTGTCENMRVDSAHRTPARRYTNSDCQTDD